MPKDNHEDKTMKITMISSLFCGSISKLITHPLDTIKAKIQVKNSSKIIKIRDVYKNTISEEGIYLNNLGIRGLYKGVPIHVIGAIPGCVLYFCSYEYFKKQILSREVKISEFVIYFFGGMFAETISCLIFVPVDVIKERLQVQSNLKTFSYKNDIHAIGHIFSNEGFRGIYKAYGATVMSFGPLSAFYFTFYEYFKGFFVRNDSKYYIEKINKNKSEVELKKHDISFGQSLICSSISSFLASIITNPLDLIKLRMQVQRAGSGSLVYRNLLQGIFYAYKNFGLIELYRGSLARAMFHTPNGAITMTLLETFKPILRNYLS